MGNKIAAITQARFSSSRLPGKVLKQLGMQTVLDLHLKRIKQSQLITNFILATTMEPEAAQIKKISATQGFSCYQGDVDDVLDRFYQSVKDLEPDYIVRLTSDCPLIDPFFIDDLIEKFLASGVDYASNCLNPTLPDGMDAEIFTFTSLKEAWENAKLKSQREHVTSYIRDCGKYKLLSIEYPFNWGEIRMTLDTIEDYEVLTNLVEICGENATTQEYVKYLQGHPELSHKNSKFQRNEKYVKGNT